MAVQSQKQAISWFADLAAVDNSATTNHTADTWDANGRPYDRALVCISHEAAEATNSSATLAVLELRHGTTTDVTNATAISGATGTTNSTASATQFVIPAHNDTSLPNVILFDVPLFDKERYLHLNVQTFTVTDTNVTAATIGAFAVLQRGPVTPTTDSALGGNEVVYL